MGKKYFKLVNHIKTTRRKLSLSEDIFVAWLISRKFSHFFSAYYILKNKTPNQITLRMIIVGIIGAVFFSIGDIYAKIIGAFFMQLWFVFDHSDGEVAREKKEFSKFGKELDYTAHIINHPLFGVAIILSLMQLKRYNVTHIIILGFLSIILDLIIRNGLAFGTIEQLKSENISHPIKNRSKLKKLIHIFIDLATIYPNFILLGSLMYFIDLYFKSNILIYYLVINVLFTMLLNIRGLWKWTLKISTIK